MGSPHAIIIKCDGAMDYDRKQTGGNGFIINFPDSFELSPIMREIRNDGQGIHRLELISIIEAMKVLLEFHKRNPGILRKAGGIEVYTDRFSATDNKFSNPNVIRRFRKNGWRSKNEKAIKNRSLLEELNRERNKLQKLVSGNIDIKHIPEKKNKEADKLSRSGKEQIPSKRVGRKIIKVCKRIHNGEEVNYSILNEGDLLKVHVYSREPIEDEFEILVEIIDGQLLGKKVKIQSNPEQISGMHLNHNYEMKLQKICKGFLKASVEREIFVNN